MRKLYVLIFGLFTTTLFYSQSTLVDLDTVFIEGKVPLQRKDSGRIVTVVDSEELRQNEGRSVAQLLDKVVGFNLNGSLSNRGQNLGYLVRGGKNRQVLVIIDGVPVNDASQIANDYDLRFLSLENIERIEILKGASSVLYGSGAGTAVISITTKNAPDQPIQLDIKSLIGTDRSSEDPKYTMNSIQNSVSVGGTLGQFFYLTKMNQFDSNGMSAIEEQEGESLFEPDDFSSFDVNLKVGVRLKGLTITNYISHTDLQSEFDNADYTDADNLSVSENLLYGGGLEWELKKGSFILNYNYNKTNREVFSSYPYIYESKVANVDTYFQYTVLSKLKTVIGLGMNSSRINSFTIPYGEDEFVQDNYESTSNFESIDPYINFVYTSENGLNVNAGARVDFHSIYNSHIVYQLNPSYHFSFNGWGLKLLGSYSTAYITPSLYQLYEPYYGNLDLSPEENTTLEEGFEVVFGNNLSFSTLFFQRREEDFIDFTLVDPANYTYQFTNSTETFNTSGIEFVLNYTIKRFLLQANYSITNSDDDLKLRVPKYKLNTRLGYTANKGHVGLSFQNVSDRDDAFFNIQTYEQERLNLEGYSLFNIDASFKVNSNIKLFFLMDNIFNEEFQELYNYQTRGRNFSFGFGLTI